MPRIGYAALAVGHALRPLTPDAQRTQQLGTALVRLAHDLADARREVKRLQRENAALRHRIARLDGESR